MLEPADDYHLLRLLEYLPAIVDGNTDDFLGLREVKLQAQVVPFLLWLLVTLLPALI